MIKIFLLLCMPFLLNAQEGFIKRSKVLMGTFASISVDMQYKSLIKPSFAIIKSIENSLSSYKKSSPIYQLNKNKKVHLDAYSYEALQDSLIYYKQTNGYFDIAIGKITKDLYRFGLKQRVASRKELQVSSTSISNLRIQKNQAVLKGNIKIDLGGMGKGFAIDKVACFLKKHDVKKAVLALSGDIRCIGSCKIAVNNPLNAKQPLATFTMNNSGVSTSGNYNRYVKSTKYNHLINPKTKISEQKFLSVTLVSTLPSATLDAYATAVSVMPVQKAYAFLDSQPLGYIILQVNKKLIISKNLVKYVRNLKLK